jgi:hypothetical protein
MEKGQAPKAKAATTNINNKFISILISYVNDA